MLLFRRLNSDDHDDLDKEKFWFLLKMSQEKKEAQREKDRLSKNAKRRVETQEESAKRNKTIQECVTKQRQNEFSSDTFNFVKPSTSIVLT